MPSDIIPYDPGHKPSRSRFPLPAVTDDGSRLCVKVYIPNIPAHRQAFIGAVYNLTRWYAWEFDEAHTGREIATVWKGVFEEMLENFYNGCPEDEDCSKCRDYLPEHPLIKYYPNDPFRTPDYTPPGYELPPWYTNPGVPLPGVIPTDAMVNLLSLAEIPIAALAEGMPRFEMTVTGRGELELEMVKIPQGGYLLLYSTNPERTRLINMQSVSVIDAVSLGALLAILGIPGDYDIIESEVVELKFDNPGEHYVLGTFIPAIGGEVLLGFGGGLRRVTLCGLSIPGEDAMYFRFRENPENSRIMQAQWEEGGEWEDILDNTCCEAPQYITQFIDNGVMQISYDNGATWEDAPPGVDPRKAVPTAPPIPGDDGDIKRCTAASSATQHLKNMEEEQATNVDAWAGGPLQLVAAFLFLLLGLGTLGASFALVPFVVGFMAAVFTAGHAAYVAAFTEEVWEKVQCAIYCNTDPDGGKYTQAQVDRICNRLNSDLTGVANTWIVGTIRTMGPNLLTNASRAGLDTGFDCSTCDCETCISHWSYPESFGEPPEDYTEDTEAGTITFSAKELAPGNWYVGLQSDTCCNITVDIIAGSATSIFQGVIPCPEPEGGYSFFVETEPPWEATPGSMDGLNCFAFLIRADGAFTVRVTFNG